MKNNYENIDKFLHSGSKFHINLGLERISLVLKLFGNPQEHINVIHIAGTNGKGSVCTLAAEILRHAGYKTALYTSPHLFKYNERFKINGNDISDDDFCFYIKETENLAKQHNIDLTEFEILTASAYKYFYDNKVDFAVMETGLGGRYDAVNVIENPFLTAITSISIDHKDRLGDTVEKIAFEKAGIIKKNVPVVVNADNHGLSVIKEISDCKNSKLYIADKFVSLVFENGVNYAVIDGEKYEFSLLGFHQLQNLSLVCKIVDVLREKSVEISEQAFEKALKTAFIPARFQYIKEKNLILDGSHNEDAARMLRKNLDFYFPDKKRIWYYSSLSTKEYAKVVNILFKPGDEVNLSGFNNALSVPPSVIESKIILKNKIKIKNHTKPENTLKFFDNNSCIIIITGSFYMIGEFVNKSFYPAG